MKDIKNNLIISNEWDDLLRLYQSFYQIYPKYENDNKLEILNIPYQYTSRLNSSIDIDVTGICIWPSCTLLCLFFDYIYDNLYEILENKIILELGSGTGLCGLYYYQKYPSNKVILTDCNDICLHVMLKNKERNFSSDNNDIIISYLNWFHNINDDDNMRYNQNNEYWNNIQSNLSLIIINDCIYNTTLLTYLFQTIHQLINNNNNNNNNIRIIINYTKRFENVHELFLNEINQNNLIIEYIFTMNDILNEIPDHINIDIDQLNIDTTIYILKKNI